MWPILPGRLFKRQMDRKKYRKGDGAISAISGAGVDMDAFGMKKRLDGSYTVEAAIVMSIVLWAVVCSIQAAFRLRDETVGAMALAEAVQELSHGEECTAEEAGNTGSSRAGHSFSWTETAISLDKTGNFLTGRKAAGTGSGGKWRLELETGIFDPENFLRKLSLLEQEE